MTYLAKRTRREDSRVIGRSCHYKVRRGYLWPADHPAIVQGHRPRLCVGPAFNCGSGLWYQAFDKNDPKLLDKVLSADWVDIPPAPNQPPGPAGAKQILTELRTAFPDLKIVIRDILQDGNKVTVRSEISGTHKAALMGFPAKNRKMTIQAIDIHEFKDGKIVRTWHTED